MAPPISKDITIPLLPSLFLLFFLFLHPVPVASLPDAQTVVVSPTIYDTLPNGTEYMFRVEFENFDDFIEFRARLKPIHDPSKQNFDDNYPTWYAGTTEQGREMVWMIGGLSPGTAYTADMDVQTQSGMFSNTQQEGTPPSVPSIQVTHTPKGQRGMEAYEIEFPTDDGGEDPEPITRYYARGNFDRNQSVGASSSQGNQALLMLDLAPGEDTVYFRGQTENQFGRSMESDAVAMEQNGASLCTGTASMMMMTLFYVMGSTVVVMAVF